MDAETTPGIRELLLAYKRALKRVNTDDMTECEAKATMVQDDEGHFYDVVIVLRRADEYPMAGVN